MKTFKRWAIGSVAVAVILLAGLSFFPKGPVHFVRVVGRSMEPTFYAGDLLLCARMPLRVGQVVYFTDEDGPAIKRVATIHPATMPGGYGYLLMSADNPDLADVEYTCGADYCGGRFLARLWRANPPAERQTWSLASEIK